MAEWAAERNHRLVWTLAGGYSGWGVTREQVADLHLLTVDAFAAAA